MFELFWELHQQRRIDEAESRSSRVASDVQNTNRKIQDLEARIDALTLACTALWSLLQSRVGLTDAEFAARLREIDLRDGKLDGRIAPEINACSKCGRTMSLRHARCLYCGGDKLNRRPFEGAR